MLLIPWIQWIHKKFRKTPLMHEGSRSRDANYDKPQATTHPLT